MLEFRLTLPAGGITQRSMGSLAWLAAALVLGFHAHVTNRWYPLAPGTVYVYRGVKGGQ